jgi:hypothetical protein
MSDDVRRLDSRAVRSSPNRATATAFEYPIQKIGYSKGVRAALLGSTHLIQV